MSNIFHIILVQPLLNALVFFYALNPWQDFGIAIILVTITIRLLLLPLSLRASQSQQKLAAIQPKVKEIQEKYKQNKEEQTRRIMELWKQEKVSPASGCLPLLIQLPILLALFRVFQTNFNGDVVSSLYTFTPVPDSFSPLFLGLINLSVPNFWMAAVAGISQFAQTKTMPKPAQAAGGDFGKIMQQQMIYVMPFMTVLIASKFAAGLALYWIITSFFTVAQQYWTKARAEYNK